MRKSISLNYVHIIFATKYRQPVLQSAWRAELFEMIARVSHSYECDPLAVGGFDDHAHILINLSRTLAAATYLSQIKSASSQWVTSHKTKLNVFRWQRGYALFSVSPTAVPNVVSYIENQDAHHAKHTFVEELDDLAERVGVRWEYEDAEDDEVEDDI